MNKEEFVNELKRKLSGLDGRSWIKKSDMIKIIEETEITAKTGDSK